MIEPTEYNKKPEFYKSTSPGNAKYSRFASTDVKSRIPKVVEIIEGSVTLNYQGKADFLIPLKYHNYAKQPLVIGFGKHPRGNVTKFPWEDTETFTNPVTQVFPLFCGVQKINQVSVQLVLNTDLTDDGINPPVYHWANKIYYYKFFVYNLP